MPGDVPSICCILTHCYTHNNPMVYAVMYHLNTDYRTKTLISPVLRTIWQLTTKNWASLRKLLLSKGNCHTQGRDLLLGVSHFQWWAMGERRQRLGHPTLIWNHSLNSHPAPELTRDGLKALAHLHHSQTSPSAPVCSLAVLFLRSFPSEPPVPKSLSQNLFGEALNLKQTL